MCTEIKGVEGRDVKECTYQDIWGAPPGSKNRNGLQTREKNRGWGSFGEKTLPTFGDWPTMR